MIINDIGFNQQEINRKYGMLCNCFNLLPIKVSAFYQNKVNEEMFFLGNLGGPLHRIAYPSNEKITMHAPGEVPDFVEDKSNMSEIGNFIIQKYENRFIFLLTTSCFGHCQYCFRQDILEEYKKKKFQSLDDRLSTVIEYANQHPKIEEIILSGGDPMTLPVKQLQKIFYEVFEKTNIRSVRIHSKILAYSPDSMSDDMIKLLSDAKIRLVSHFSHPYEICDIVAKKLDKINKQGGIKLYNQFPLLRKVNDHPELIIKHLKLLDEMNMRNLSIFIPDPINYSASYRIPISRLKKIVNEVNWSSPSWVNSTRFVLDTKYGKVRLDDIKEYDTGRNLAIFQREGHNIEYHDFPEALDEPGDLQTMLWRERLSHAYGS